MTTARGIESKRLKSTRVGDDDDESVTWDCTIDATTIESEIETNASEKFKGSSARAILRRGKLVKMRHSFEQGDEPLSELLPMSVVYGSKTYVRNETRIAWTMEMATR